MSNPSDGFSLRLERPWEPNSGKGTLGDYLDDFCLPLYEVMAEKDVTEYRWLAEEHILEISEEFKGQGLSSHGALLRALREHGNPQLIGRLLRDEWLRGEKSCPHSLVVHAVACRTIVLCAVSYLCLSLLMWLAPRDSPVPLLAFFLSPLPVGCLVGAIAFYRFRRPVFWAVAVMLYSLILTTLLIYLRWDMSAAVELMPFWGIVTLAVASGMGLYWQRRRQHEIVRRFLA